MRLVQRGADGTLHDLMWLVAGTKVEGRRQQVREERSYASAAEAEAHIHQFVQGLFAAGPVQYVFAGSMPPEGFSL